MPQVYTTSTGAGNRIESRRGIYTREIIELIRRAVRDSI